MQHKLHCVSLIGAIADDEELNQISPHPCMSLAIDKLLCTNKSSCIQQKKGHEIICDHDVYFLKACMHQSPLTKLGMKRPLSLRFTCRKVRPHRTPSFLPPFPQNQISCLHAFPKSVIVGESFDCSSHFTTNIRVQRNRLTLMINNTNLSSC